MNCGPYWQRPKLRTTHKDLRVRHSTDKRIRGRKLQAIRANHFASNPLCVHCEAKGRIRLATELDHTVALANGGKDEPGNRQGLCAECHEAKTRLDLGYRIREAIGPDGEPISE